MLLIGSFSLYSLYRISKIIKGSGTMVKCTKEGTNIYFHCRKEAAKLNPAINSREGAAGIFGISAESLRDYERDATRNIPAYVVLKMIKAYNAPELRNYYCHNSCPLGGKLAPEIDLKQLELDRLTLRLLNTFKKVTSIKETLVEIAADGMITADEKPKLDDILETLDAISRHAQELRVWAEKNLPK
jgi:hypothetical protein